MQLNSKIEVSFCGILLLASTMLMPMQLLASHPVEKNKGIRPSDEGFQFWRQKLPGVVVPQVLLARKSPLRLRDVKQFYRHMSDNSLSLYTSQLCPLANLWCNQSVNVRPLVSSNYGAPHPGKHFRTGAEQPIENLFFSPEKLREGGEITLPDIDDPSSSYAFLPRVLADKLPFSSDKLPELKRIFHISKGSNMSQMMDMVMKWCEFPHEGDAGKCSTSIEDMVDFVISAMGSNVEILSQPDRPGHESVRVMKVESKSSSGMKPSVVCHNFVFPYAVYYCHHMNYTQAFKAWVKSSMDGKVTVRPVICHSSQDAKAEERNTLCHFLLGSHFSWMPATT